MNVPVGKDIIAWVPDKSIGRSKDPVKFNYHTKVMRRLDMPDFQPVKNSGRLTIWLTADIHIMCQAT
jgi:hypothetical protein